VFTGAIGALGIMTLLSAYVGHATTVIPRIYTVYLSTALFIFFGLKLLKEGYYMDPNEGQEELEEVAMELNRKEQEIGSQNGGVIGNILSPVFIQSFVMTFLAEWGDRSQIATIILGAREVYSCCL
jgi:putative Ca2+/H+ antiporter (TMEM165/GDT1 family)